MKSWIKSQREYCTMYIFFTEQPAIRALPPHIYRVAPDPPVRSVIKLPLASFCHKAYADSVAVDWTVHL